MRMMRMWVTAVATGRVRERSEEERRKAEGRLRRGSRVEG